MRGFSLRGSGTLAAIAMTAGCFSSSSSSSPVVDLEGGVDAGEDAQAAPVDATMDAPGLDSATLDSTVTADALADAPVEGGASADSGASTSDAAVDAAPSHVVTLVEGNGAGSLAQGMVAQGGNLYWVLDDVLGSSVNPGVQTAGIDGGAITGSVEGQTGPFNHMCGLTTDSAYLYWVACAPQGVVARIPLDSTDGGFTVLGSGYYDMGTSVAVDSNDVYWSNGTSVAATDMIQSLSLTADGAAPTVIAAGPRVAEFAIDGTNVYWTSPASGAPYDAGLLFSAPLTGVPDGGSPSVLASGLIFPDSIAVYGGNIYWINDGDYQNDDSVMMLPVTGLVDGGAPTTLVSGVNAYGPIAADADGVYFAVNSDGTSSNPTAAIWEIPVGGGAPITLASGLGSIEGLAADANNVYWVDSTLQTISKVSKR